PPPSVVLLASVLLLILAAAAPSAEFRASAVKVDITPDRPQWLLGYQARQSDGVNDRLYHRVVALDDGASTRLFIVSTDIAVISPGYYDQVCRDILKELGTGPESIWWLNTHTHSAPEVGPPGIAAIF